ncbi:unnamed protein product, partial [Pylaiella littoralis]
SQTLAPPDTSLPPAILPKEQFSGVSRLSCAQRILRSTVAACTWYTRTHMKRSIFVFSSFVRKRSHPYFTSTWTQVNTTYITCLMALVGYCVLIHVDGQCAQSTKHGRVAE